MKTHILYYISLTPCLEHFKQQKQQFGADKILIKHMAAETLKRATNLTAFALWCFQVGEQCLTQGLPRVKKNTVKRFDIQHM